MTSMLEDFYKSFKRPKYFSDKNNQEIENVIRKSEISQKIKSIIEQESFVPNELIYIKFDTNQYKLVFSDELPIIVSFDDEKTLIPDFTIEYDKITYNYSEFCNYIYKLNWIYNLAENWFKFESKGCEMKFHDEIPFKFTIKDDIDIAKIEIEYNNIKFTHKEFIKYIEKLNSVLSIIDRLCKINFLETDIVVIK